MTAFVYVIASHDGTGWRSYVGWSTDVLRRLSEHNGTKRGAKSTRGRHWQLIHVEAFAEKSAAMRREWFLKRDRTARKRMIANVADGMAGALEMPQGPASLPPETAAENVMQAKALIVAALALAACAAPEPEIVTHDGVPLLGQVQGTLAGAPVSWNTYDFSVGAFDASAYIEQGIFTLQAFEPGAPHVREGVLVVKAPVLEMAAGALTLGPAHVGLVDNREWDNPRLRDMAGTVTVTAFTTEQPLGQSGYGRVTGAVTAQLCAQTGGDCQPLVLAFDTRLQISP